jgi:NCAIR mutase (PurE)-related protein
MEKRILRDILEKLLKGKISIEEAEKSIKSERILELSDFAKIDLDRESRKGMPEIVLAEGKKNDQLTKITSKILDKCGRVFISRANDEQISSIKKSFNERISYVNEENGLIVLKNEFKPVSTGGRIGILTAGTSDIPIAEEARVIAEEMGCKVVSSYDVGVAGIHRLVDSLKKIADNNVDVLIIIAGREGALPTVVAGLVDIPIIGVPTSTSYGFGKDGVSALAAMLQTCSLGLAVVNIDGGIPAGTFAALIANKIAKERNNKKITS